jgi:hypothetical protein
MFRRTLNALLLAAGVVALVWALRNLPGDPRRAAAVAGLAAVGIALNLTGLTRKTLDVRPWLRVLACAVAAIAAAAALLLWHRLIHEALPGVPEDQLALREKVTTAGASLLWITISLIYVGTAIALLPPREASGRTDTD